MVVVVVVLLQLVCQIYLISRGPRFAQKNLEPIQMDCERVNGIATAVRVLQHLQNEYLTREVSMEIYTCCKFG